MMHIDHIPLWRCPKIVRGDKIIAIDADENDSEYPWRKWTLACGEVLDIPDSVVSRGFPQIGDYVVLYDDGYMSWSPVKAFEEGYTRV